ncbi:clotting factor B-like [Dermacentor variabilis]|uniref:clotting factor B-like n=1 Tax=Dermacentor variabilis TaxID=34621 RepID=UPI003F5BC9D2
MLTAGWRMRRRPSSALLLLDLLVLLFLHEEAEAARVARGPCRARHPTKNFELTDGRCMPVHECLQSLKDVGRLKFPIFCGVEILLPIVCCPLRNRPRGTTATPNEQVSATLPPASPTMDRSEAVISEPQEEPHHFALSSQPAVPVIFSGSADEPPAECETPGGQQGACLPLESCMPLREQVRRKEFPPLCDLRGTTPYACCPARLFRQGSQHIDTVETTPAPPDDMSSAAVNRAIRVTQIMLENNRYCGKTPAQQSMRPWRYTPTVLGGRSVSLGKYAFAVAIFRDEVKILNYWCGGTLITSRVVLSAAHCFVYSLNDTKYIARVGGVNISDVSNTTFVQRNVASVHLHPEYNDRHHYNDVALLLLDLPARQLGVPKPFACLPDADSAATVHGIATVLGWGHNAFGGTLQTVLQEAQVPLVNNDACDRAYHSLGSYDREFPHGVNEHFVCAGNTTDGGVDACQQDSGGPLVVNVDRDGGTYYELVGVVSFGVGCGSAAFPGVYASVSHFMPWILNATVNIVPEEAYDRINFI